MTAKKTPKASGVAKYMEKKAISPAASSVSKYMARRNIAAKASAEKA
jgi:hypothetical protein